MNSRQYDATTHSDITSASAKEDELTTIMVKQDGTVEDQGNNRKPVDKTSEATTEDSTSTENPNKGKENTNGVSKLTGNTTRSKINIRKEMRRYQLYKIGVGLSQYLFGTLFLPMLICGIISFIVLNLKHNRGRSTCVYMAALAGSDTLSLLHNFRIWIQHEAKLHPSTNPLCKFNVFFLQVTWTMSAFLVAAMSMDKCYAILVPHLAKIKCTAKRARVNCGILFFVVVIFYAPLVVYSGLNSTSGYCVRYNMEAWYVTAYMYTSVVVYPLIPFLLIICLNGTILVNLWQRKHSGFTPSSQIHKAESQLTRMIIVVSLAFVILMFPFEIRTMYMYYTGYSQTAYEAALHMFTFHVTLELTNINSGINFILYVCSSVKFRQDLKTLFMRPCRRDTRVFPNWNQQNL